MGKGEMLRVKKMGLLRVREMLWVGKKGESRVEKRVGKRIG